MKLTDIKMPLVEYKHQSIRCTDISQKHELIKHQIGLPIYSWNRVYKLLNIKKLNELMWNSYHETINAPSGDFQYHIFVCGDTVNLALFKLQYSDGKTTLANNDFGEEWGCYRINTHQGKNHFGILHLFKAGSR